MSVFTPEQEARICQLVRDEASRLWATPDSHREILMNELRRIAPDNGMLRFVEESFRRG